MTYDVKPVVRRAINAPHRAQIVAKTKITVLLALEIVKRLAQNASVDAMTAVRLSKPARQLIQ